MKKDTWFIRNLTAISIILAFIILLFIAIIALHPSYNALYEFSLWKLFKFNIDTKLAGELGDFIGGYLGTIVLIITVFLLYKTLIEQKKSFELQSFENKFFDLLKIHRDNIAEIQLHPREKRSVFVILRAEFQDIYDVVKKYYILEDTNNADKANITYILLFFGVRDQGAEMAKNLLEKYDKDSIQKIIDELTQIKNVSDCKYLSDYTSMAKYEPFNGHQSRLGHYFRHLYQTVNFVDKKDDKFLSQEEKKYYVKTLRAQLSNHELSIFFYNSLSNIGRNWRVGEEKSLIVKYQLLKNIPLSGFTFELNPKSFYKLDYEWDEIKTSERKI